MWMHLANQLLDNDAFRQFLYHSASEDGQVQVLYSMGHPLEQEGNRRCELASAIQVNGAPEDRLSRNADELFPPERRLLHGRHSQVLEGWMYPDPTS
jgi:hypothetical protein